MPSWWVLWSWLLVFFCSSLYYRSHWGHFLFYYAIWSVVTVSLFFLWIFHWLPGSLSFPDMSKEFLIVSSVWFQLVFFIYFYENVLSFYVFQGFILHFHQNLISVVSSFCFNYVCWFQLHVCYPSLAQCNIGSVFYYSHLINVCVFYSWLEKRCILFMAWKASFLF